MVCGQCALLLLVWATMVAAASAFDVTDPVWITLFAAGVTSQAALLAPNRNPETVFAPSGGRRWSQRSPLL